MFNLEEKRIGFSFKWQPTLFTEALKGSTVWPICYLCVKLQLLCYAMLRDCTCLHESNFCPLAHWGGLVICLTISLSALQQIVKDIRLMLSPASQAMLFYRGYSEFLSFWHLTVKMSSSLVSLFTSSSALLSLALYLFVWCLKEEGGKRIAECRGGSCWDLIMSAGWRLADTVGKNVTTLVTYIRRRMWLIAELGSCCLCN